MACFHSRAFATCTASVVGSFVCGAVEPERAAGERHVHLHAVGLHLRGARRGQPRVLGRFGRRPHLEDAVVAASGTRRCSAPSVRARGRAARRGRRWRGLLSPSGPRRRPRRAPPRHCSPDSMSRRCSARSSSELRRSAWVSSHSTSRACRPRCASSKVSPTTATPSAIGTTATTPATCEGGAVVDVARDRAEPRWVEDDSGQQSRVRDVDRVLGLAEDLRGRIDAEAAFATDEPVVRPRLRLDPFGHRELPGPCRQLAEGGRPAGRMPENTGVDLDLAGSTSHRSAAAATSRARALAATRR